MKDFEAAIENRINLLINNNELIEAKNLLLDLIATSTAITPNAILLLANINLKIGEIDQGIELINKLLDIDPNKHEYIILLCKFLIKKGDFESAKFAIEKISNFKQDENTLKIKIDLLLHAGKINDALEQIENLLKINNTNYIYWYMIAALQKQIGNLELSEEYCNKSLTLNPSFSESLLLSADNQLRVKNYKFSLLRTQQAIRLNSNNAEGWNSLGNIHMQQCNFQKAVSSYKIASKISLENSPLILNNLATSLKFIGQNCESLKLYELLINKFPNYLEGRKNYAYHLLLMGNYSEGFEQLEIRLKEKKFEGPLSRYQNIWNKHTDPKGKIILVIYEQGFGDTIQFSRFIFDLRSIASQIIFICPLELIDFFKFLFRKHSDILVISKITNESYEISIPLLSLPYLLYLNDPQYKLTGRNIKYETPQKVADKFRSIMPKTNKLNIGITLSGRNTHPLNKFRSIEPSNIEELLLLDHNFFLIQKEASASELSFIDQHKSKITCLNQHIINFSDTAGILKNLDLLISVDTSVLHLAASIGVKCYLLNPFVSDWRWGEKLSTTDWYQNIKIFRQKKYPFWNDAIHEVVKSINLDFPNQ